MRLYAKVGGALVAVREQGGDPLNAPTGFIRKRWESYVFTAEGIDRRFYELCVIAELKNALRSGDVSISGSRQFRAFEEYLMPHAEFNEGLADGSLRLAL